MTPKGRSVRNRKLSRRLGSQTYDSPDISDELQFKPMTKPLLEHAVRYSHGSIPQIVVETRSIQLLQNAAENYHIHRDKRYAMMGGDLAPSFDALATSIPGAHRINGESILFDYEGVTAWVRGWRKKKYCSCTVEVWATTVPLAQTALNSIEGVLDIDHRIIRSPTFSVDWKFRAAAGLDTASFEELADDELFDEAYPYLGESVTSFIDRYLDSDEIVLIMLGPPGTGKTRFCRYIFRRIADREGSCRVLFTGDQACFQGDQLFVEFVTESHDIFVIEDADHLLEPRASGNLDLHSFLTVADGVVRAQGRKIVFTTNLPSISNLDEALIRPGRCFATVNTRQLSQDEAQALVNKIAVTPAQVIPHLTSRLSLASIYRLCKAHGGLQN